MIWEALHRLALLGTVRGQLPEEVVSALEKVGLDSSRPAEQVLLEGAALYHQLQRAGFPLKPVPASQERAPLFELPHQPPAAARQLRHIVQGNYQDALAEYLKLSAPLQRQLPPELLPDIFYYALKNPALWKQLRPLLSQRDHWLLRQNPDWSTLAEQPPVENWQSASALQRIWMLRYLRYRQPEAGRQALEQIWASLHYTEKKALLAELQTGLNPGDEAFLEQARGDKRKEVRSTAAGLLLKLPSSSLQRELFAQAKPLVALNQQNGLQLEWPEAPAQALKQAGGKKGKPKEYPGGEPAGWAFELFSKIAPQRWEAHFQRPTLDTLRLFLRSNQPRLLTDALAEAALLHQDHRWIEALLLHWQRTGQADRWNAALGKRMIHALPEHSFNEILEQHLRQQPAYLEEESLATHLLCQNAHDWSPAVSKAVLLGFQEWLNSSQSYYWNLWHYKRVLKVAAYRATPDLLKTLQQGWNERSPVWPRWASDVERMQGVMAFRIDLRRSLA